MESSNYERWKRVYEIYPLEDLPWELSRPREVLVELLESNKVKKGKALDICCGAGTNTVYIASKGFETTGIDISPKAIEIAKEKARKAGVKIRFIAGNALHLPFNDEEFDFIFDMGCFHHILPEDRELFIKGVHRTLKTGGKYLLTCFSYKNGYAWNHLRLIQDFYLKCIRINLFAKVDLRTQTFFSTLDEVGLGSKEVTEINFHRNLKTNVREIKVGLQYL